MAQALAATPHKEVATATIAPCNILMRRELSVMFSLVWIKVVRATERQHAGTGAHVSAGSLQSPDKQSPGPLQLSPPARCGAQWSVSSQ